MPRKPETAPEAEATPPFAVKDVTFAGTQQVAALAPLKSPAERAVLALNSSERETSLVELVQKSADIVEVKNPDARAQVHRMAMDLKNTRVEIEKESKAAREDATKFSKAVIAEEARLIAITDAEEKRLFKLRDDFDAEQARIAKEEKERNEARIAAIQAKIDAITALPREHAAADSATLKAALKQLGELSITKEEFAELTDAATLAFEATASALFTLHGGAVQREQEEAERVRLAEEERQRIAAQAEANRIEAERLAAERLKAEQAAKEVADAAAALKLAQEQQQRTMQAVQNMNLLAEMAGGARDLSVALDTARACPIDVGTFGVGVPMVQMAQGMAVKTLEHRLALSRDEAHAEALEMDQAMSWERCRAVAGDPLPLPDLDPEPSPAPLSAEEPEPAPSPAPAPKPAALPLPESYSVADELIDMGALTDAADKGDRIYRIISGEDVVKAVAKNFGLDWYGAVSVLRNLDFHALASVGELADA